MKNEDDLNLYAYVYNDPLDGTDPTGGECETVSGGGQVPIITCKPKPDPLVTVTVAAAAPATTFEIVVQGTRTAATAIGGTAAAILALPAMLLTPSNGLVGHDFRDESLNSKGSNVMAVKDGKKKSKSGVSGKAGAKDIPSWAKGERPNVGESGKEFADRLLDEKYGKGNYPTGPGSEHSKIQKWGDRSFE